MTINFSTDRLGDAVQRLLRGPDRPDREFVRHGATFGDVYKMAADLSAVLAEQDPTPAVVCLAAEDKALMAAALLASLAGGPPLLLPYAFSASVLAKLQGETGFTAALTDTARDFPPAVQILPRQMPDGSGLPLCKQTSLRRELLSIYTGGSTGTPQLWSKTVSNLFSEGFFLAQHFSVKENDCILATIPPYHIYGLLFSVILPLVSSATVVGCTPSFPNDITAAAKEHGATILTSVPAHYRVLREQRMGFRLAFSSAGMLDATDNQMFCSNNAAGIVEVYGSTETGGIATRNRSRGEVFFTPFPLISWKVSDSVLAVRSPFISPELPVDQDGFFLTSDRVEAQGVNRFSLLGRVDTVTKVGGKRVDLEEISTIVRQQPGVNNCVVVALPEEGARGNRIGVLLEGEAASVSGIRQRLTLSLESYALPRRIRKVAHIPTAPNGKYDFQAITRLLTQ